MSMLACYYITTGTDLSKAKSKQEEDNSADKNVVITHRCKIYDIPGKWNFYSNSIYR